MPILTQAVASAGDFQCTRIRMLLTTPTSHSPEDIARLRIICACVDREWCRSLRKNLDAEVRIAVKSRDETSRVYSRV